MLGLNSKVDATGAVVDFFRDHERLSKKLMVDEFIEDGKYFILKDQSVGVVYGVELFEHEASKNESIIEMNRKLKSWLSLNDEFSIQYVFSQGKVEESDLKPYLEDEFSGNSQLADFLHEKRIESLLENSNNEYPLFNRKGYLVVTKRSRLQKSTLRDRLPQRAHDLLFKEVETYTKEIKKFEKTIRQFEELSPLKLERLGCVDVLSLIREMLYDGGETKNRRNSYSSAYSLSEQVLDRGIDVDFAGKNGKGDISRVFSLKVPGISYPAMGAWLLTLPFPFKVSIQLYKPPQAKVDLYLNWKEFSLKNSLSEKAKREFEDVKDIKKQLAYEQDAIWMTYTITLNGKTVAEIEEMANELKKIADDKFEAFLIEEEDIGLSMWWDTIPFQYKPHHDGVFQRSFPLLTNDLLKLIPVYDSGRGDGVPFQLLQTREGNIAPLSLFGGTSSHTLFLGDTGTGKSRLLGDVICSAKRPQSDFLVFIFEVKTSYPMLVNYFGGEINKYKVSEPPSSSPFKGVYDEEKILFLTNWIKTAVEITSPSFKIESELREAIYQAIKRAAEKRKKSASTTFVDSKLVSGSSEIEIVIDFDDVQNELANLPSDKAFEAMTEQISDLLGKLAIFQGDGIYSSYFKPQGVWEDIKGGIFDSDFEGVKSDPVIRDLTFLQEFEKIRQIRMQPENQGKEIIIILDEIADLDRGIPLFADIISSWAETGRKEGVWFFFATCTPQVFNDPNLKACRTCMSVASNYVFTAMSDENLAELENEYSIIDDRDKAIIRSLKTVKGKHSEFYVIKGDGSRCVYRLVESPVKRWLQPTNVQDTNKALKAIQKFNGDALKAAEYLCLEEKKN